MKVAADCLTQYLELLAEGEGDSSGRVSAEGLTQGLTQGSSQSLAQGSNRGADLNGAAAFLMVQAQQALTNCTEFRCLLAQVVPEGLRGKAQRWLVRRLHQCATPERLESWVEQELVKMVPSIQADEALIQLILQIQELPKESRDRRNLIQQLLIEIQSSDRLKRRLTNLPPDLYNDALHNTLLWFCDRIDDYDPSLSGPMTWFNRNLFYQGMKILRSLNRPQPARLAATEEDRFAQGGPDAYDALMVEAEYQILDELYDWVQQDISGDLKRTALTHRLDINVQSVTIAVLNRFRMLRSLGRASSERSASMSVQPYDIFSEQPTNLSQLFEYLSAQLDYPPEKLRRFWREKCRPYIEDFLQQSGNR